MACVYRFSIPDASLLSFCNNIVVCVNCTVIHDQAALRNFRCDILTSLNIALKDNGSRIGFGKHITLICGHLSCYHNPHIFCFQIHIVTGMDIVFFLISTPKFIIIIILVSVKEDQTIATGFRKNIMACINVAYELNNA